MALSWDPSQQNYLPDEELKKLVDLQKREKAQEKFQGFLDAFKQQVTAPKWQVAPPDWRKQREASFFRQVKGGLYRQLIQPMYDTLRLDGKDTVTEQNAFVTCVGQSENGKCKTYADTNMQIGGSLCTPNHGYWNFLRVHFERYTTIEDITSWKEKASIEFFMGQMEVKWRGTLGTMKPILPKSMEETVARKIKRGVIKVWPWYEAAITPTLAYPLEVFGVRVSYTGGFKPQNPMQFKIMLGPFFYAV